jgi:hypothetical protein
MAARSVVRFIIVVLCVGALPFVLIGCGDGRIAHETVPPTPNTTATGSASATAAPTTTEQATTTTQDRGPRFGDTVEVWGLAVTVSPPEPYIDAVTARAVGDDVEMTAVLVTIVNDSDLDWSYSLLEWEGQDQEGFMYRGSLYVQKQELGSGTAAAGRMVKGYLGFELPKGAALAAVTYRPMAYELDPSQVIWEQ